MWNTFRVPFFLSRDVLDVVEFPKDPCSSVPGAISVKWLSSDKKAVEAGAIPDGDTSFKHQSFKKNVKRGYVCGKDPHTLRQTLCLFEATAVGVSSVFPFRTSRYRP